MSHNTSALVISLLNSIFRQCCIPLRGSCQRSMKRSAENGVFSPIVGNDAAGDLEAIVAQIRSMVLRRGPILGLLSVLIGGLAAAQPKPSVPTHCASDERVVFSCPFRQGKTASLCASADLSRTTGTLQYRYGVLRKPPELVFPHFGTHENPIYDHPVWNFQWSSSHRTNSLNGQTAISTANTRWSTANVPVGESVFIGLVFTPIEDHPEINFVVEAQAGPASRYEGVTLTIYESVGKGRTMAEHRCIKEKTTEDLFSLKDFLQK